MERLLMMIFADSFEKEKIFRRGLQTNLKFTGLTEKKTRKINVRGCDKQKIKTNDLLSRDYGYVHIYNDTDLLSI
ncbi:hypothetical protein RCL_jg28194.t1 [Rhizophagus clarus]|uniref:Uncharacterized protein n=1 Tax=Rhizophagus clarus TaxID=94130 RepID=A0A8H3LV76_9GLOM|nr:hypothetical protein RCL_jg28194.t1 [Rhizophagus clarus]